VKVAVGYGRNYLVPKGLAMAVTPENKALIARERKALESRLLKEKAELQVVADKIDGIRMVAPRKVGENDVLYGSVTSSDIAEWLAGKGVEIDKRKVQLEEPIKKLGDHEVKIRLHAEIEARLKVLVSKEG
jgi:large subunit ribosomal protein L9